jgi:hypothetical protein
MKLLLTSAGVKNTSIHDTLVDLLGKPMADANALCIPTASYGHPMVMAPHIGEEAVRWQPAGGGDRALGMVDFSIFPHLDHVNLPEDTMADAEKWAAALPVPGYGIDDETAIKVTDGVVEVVSEGHWKLFTP